MQRLSARGKINMEKGKSKEKEAKSHPIKKDIGIIELVEKYPETAGVLMQHGFHCLGCAAANFETLEQGAAAHGIDIDKLVKELNKAVEEKGKEKEEKKEKR